MVPVPELPLETPLKRNSQPAAPDFSISRWHAFQRLLEGEKPADVAAALGISLNAVYLAKSSILKRLRQDMETLSD